MLDDRLTPVGRSMARLPIDPRLARMLVEAAKQGALSELLIIASGLALQDPRERPLEARGSGGCGASAVLRQTLRLSRLPESVELARDERARKLSASALKRACQQRFLSFLRMREWRDLHRQLRAGGAPLGSASGNEAGATTRPSTIDRRGLAEPDRVEGRTRRLSGCAWSAVSDLSRARRSFRRAPNGSLAARFRRRSEFMRGASRTVEPEWIEAAAQHLVKRSYGEPHWDARRGETIAHEKVTLFGLPLVEKRRVSFKRIDPAQSRDIFIRFGLLAGAVTTKAEFLQHNLALVREIRVFESKQRRRDLLVADEVLAAFYAERIPADVTRRKRARTVAAACRAAQPDGVVHVPRTRAAASGCACGRRRISVVASSCRGSNSGCVTASRRGQSDDGVSLQVPLGLLAHVRGEPLDWLVPGLLGAKCEALIRSLPKALRRPLAPVPEKIEQIVPALLREDVYRHGRLERVLGERLEGFFDVKIPLDAWRSDAIDPHLKMNVQVRDNKGDLVDQDRDVAALLGRLQARVTQRIGAQRVRESLEAHHLTRFPGFRGSAATRARRRSGASDRLSGAGGPGRQRVAGDGPVDR